MQKLLISLPLIATLALTGCSSSEERNPNTPQSSWLESIPVVYRQDIQQGNIVTQENVNRLEPGMSKRQVRFILGTPMLTDVFHADRWDYLYSMTEGWGDREQKRLTVYFKDDQLISVEGDYRPQPADQQTGPKKETVVSVPDWEDPDAGIFTKAARMFSGSSDTAQSASDKADARREKAESQAKESEAIRDMGNAPPGAR